MTVYDIIESQLLQGRFPEHPSSLDKPLVKLSELKPKTYVNTIVRVTYIKSREKRDELGRRPYIFGIAEDSTFKVPFLCYKPYSLFFKDSVFEFRNAYVHEFKDHSLLLVLTEYSKINYVPEEPIEDYLWQPKIGDIRRPLGYCRVTLEGIVSKVYRSSGLVKRCEKCSRVIFDDSCLACNGTNWYWSLRINSRLSDESGSINTVFPEHLTCRLLGRSISEILFTAQVPNSIKQKNFTRFFRV